MFAHEFMRNALIAGGYWLKPPAALISLAGQSSPLSFLAFFLALVLG